MSPPPDVECAPPADAPVRQDKYFQSFVVFVTQACNLRCDYCYLSKRPRSMNAETVARVAEFVGDHTAPDAKEIAVCFFGGEPLLVPETIERLADAVLARARRNNRKTSFSMTTNGTRVTAANAALLHQYGIRTKVSLDGIGPAHDRHRTFTNGRGSFARIVENLDRIKALPGITVRVTVSPDNVGSLATSARWLADQGFPHLFFSPVVEAIWTEESLTTLLDQYEALYRLMTEYPQTSFANLVRDSERLRRSRQKRHGCGAAVSMAAIDSDGHLYPCHRYVGYFASQADRHRIGNVLSGVDGPARRRFIKNGRLAARQQCGLGLYLPDSTASERTCIACQLLPVCHSSCMAVNEIMTGDAHRPSPINRLLAQICAATSLSHRAAPGCRTAHEHRGCPGTMAPSRPTAERSTT